MIKTPKERRGFKWRLRRLLNSSFDNRLEEFVLSLLKIKGMEELLSDFGRGRLVWYQISTIAELINLKSIVVESHVPAAARSARLTQKQASKSKYSQYFSGVDFNDPVNEVIRINYVTAFHKFEGYREHLMTLVNERGRELYGKEVDIYAYLRDVHKFKLDDNKNYPETIQRINWICNCVKHYRGYPRKKSPPVSCLGFDPSARIILSQQDFVRDIDYLIDFTSRLFVRALIAVGCIRLQDIFDNSGAEEKSKLTPSIILVLSLVVVSLHSLKDENDNNVAEKWMSFSEKLPKYLKSLK